MTTPTYPAVEVELIGTDGNAFALIGKVAKALRREVSREASDKFKAEAMSQGSYDELLALIMRTVEVS